MLKKPCTRQSHKEDHENKLIIEKWMERNSNNKVIIGQDVEKLSRLKRKPNKALTCDIKVSERKKVVIPVEISENKLSKLTNIKRAHSFPEDDVKCSPPKTKIIRQSLTHKSASVSTYRTTISSSSITRKEKVLNKTKPNIEIIPTKAVLPKSTKLPNKTTPIIEVIKTTSNIIDNKISSSTTPPIKHNVGKSPTVTKATQIIKNLSSPSVKCSVTEISPVAKATQIIKNLSSPSVKCSVTEISPVAKGTQIVKHLSPPTINCNIVKTTKMKGVANAENNVGAGSNEENNSLKKNDDVYICLLENYRYLIIPKQWSVNELTNERRNRNIVFFNNQVIEDKGILISVIKKSLIIDKGAKMNYSVHGLPIAIEGTILPNTLDDTKKLLSILHIFDKMQVCEGLGSDLNVVQNSIVFKDIYRYWRHKNCKIILTKTTRCLECTEARNAIMSEPQPYTIKHEIEFVNVAVKTEEDSEISKQI